MTHWHLAKLDPSEKVGFAPMTLDDVAIMDTAQIRTKLGGVSAGTMPLNEIGSMSKKELQGLFKSLRLGTYSGSVGEARKRLKTVFPEGQASARLGGCEPNYLRGQLRLVAEPTLKRP